MAEVNWEEPFCGEGASCFRLGTDADGNGYISILGQENHYLSDSRDALRNLIRESKAGKANHLLWGHAKRRICTGVADPPLRCRVSRHTS